MGAYWELTAARVPTRAAARLTGVSRATAARHARRPVPLDRDPVVPANRLSAREREGVLAVLDSDEFVDAAPLQVYARLLDRGVYLELVKFSV